MNFYRFECSKFTKNDNIKIKHKIDEKLIIIFAVLTTVFKRVEIWKKATKWYCEHLNYVKQCYHIVSSVEKNRKQKSEGYKDKVWRTNAFIKIWNVNKKSRSVKKQGATGSLSNLRVKTHFSKTPLLDDILY